MKQNSFNCLSYAIGVYNKHIFLPLGARTTITGFKKTVIQYLTEKKGFTVRDVTNEGGQNYPTSGHTWLIAIRIGSFVSGKKIYYDYHFMKRANTDKRWSFKAGKGGKVLQLLKSKKPNNVDWNTYKSNGRVIHRCKVYTSKIVYLAVTD